MLKCKLKVKQAKILKLLIVLYLPSPLRKSRVLSEDWIMTSKSISFSKSKWLVMLLSTVKLGLMSTKLKMECLYHHTISLSLQIVPWKLWTCMDNFLAKWWSKLCLLTVNVRVNASSSQYILAKTTLINLHSFLLNKLLTKSWTINLPHFKSKKLRKFKRCILL